MRKGDRVAFVCPNIPALLEAHFGVPAAGGILVALNYRLTATDIAGLLEHSGARFVFVDREFAHLVAGANGVSRNNPIVGSTPPGPNAVMPIPPASPKSARRMYVVMPGPGAGSPAG